MVTQKKAFSGVYETLKSFIKKYVEDPKHRNPKKDYFIHASFPNLAVYNYPFIILSSPDLTEKDRTFGTNRIKQISFEIIVYATDPAELDKICDDLYYAFTTYASDLRKDGIYNIELDRSPYDWDLDEHGKKVYYRKY